MKSNKNIKIVMLIVLSLCLIGLTDVQKTYSSFKSKEDNALVYKAQLYNFYSEKTMKLEQANVDNAKFSFTFKANLEGFNKATDFYELTIPDSCTFDEIILSGTGINVDKTSHSQKVTFSEDSDGTAFVYMTCRVEHNKNLSYVANISETILNQQSLLYLRYSYKESYSDYLDRFKEEITDSKSISDSDTGLYDKFITWIKQYGGSVGYEAEIEKYARDTFPNESALKNPNNYNALPGLKIEHINNIYTFKIVDNFVGYARTYYKSTTVISENKNLYFSTKTKSSLYQALKIYLNNYLFPSQTDTANLVYNYIYNGDYLYNVIFNNAIVSGIALEEYDEASGNSNIFFTKSFVLSSALSAANDKPYIVFDTSGNMLNSFSNGLIKFYSETVSRDTMVAIRRRADVQASITKNNSSVSTKVAFTDYFIHQDGNRYLIIKVSSDGLYNTFSITPFAVSDSNVIITFTNSNTDLTINIKHSKKDIVLKTVSDLDKYFNTTTTINSNNILSDTSTECIVEYKITK